MPKRNVNVELFRVIATAFVVLLHVLGKGGILKSAVPTEANYWTAWFLKSCANCAVDCFALISGFVMVDKSIKAKKIVSLWFQVLFYSLLFSTLFFIFLPECRTIKNAVVAILPVVGKQWWYVSSYFALFFFIPFLNEAIKHISKQTYKKFLVVVLIGICFLDCIVARNAFIFSDGFSAIWLIVCYLFGAYIKKYHTYEKISASKSILGFFSMVVLTFASKVIIHFFAKAVFGQVKYDNIFISYTSITILLAAIFLFMFCLNIKVNSSLAKFICFLSPAALGIYLIHVHPFIFEFTIKKAFISYVNKPVIVMLLYIFATALLIFVLCAVIELLRIQLFKIIGINKWSEIIAQKLHNFYLKAIKRISLK